MSRINSVDVFRLLAIIAVVAVHTSPFRVTTQAGDEVYNYLDVVINQTARFAVPFFFVISGYFWGVKIRAGSKPVPFSIEMGKRILVIFLVWCLIYLLPYNVTAFYNHGLLGPVKSVYWDIVDLLQRPMLLIFQGTKVHLWFLIGLLCSLALAAIFVHKKWIKSLIVVSLLLYVFGVIAKAYSDTPIGFTTEFNTRNGPFFGTIFFVTGYFMSRAAPSTSWVFYGFLLFCFGWVVHFSEVYVLWTVFGTAPKHDYVFGTYFMGVGVAMASLSNHPALQSRALGRIGQVTLGIYAVHMIYVEIFEVVEKSINSPLWEVGYVAVVLLFSILSALALSKFKVTKNIV